MSKMNEDQLKQLKDEDLAKLYIEYFVSTDTAGLLLNKVESEGPGSILRI